ncbi:TetR/AcrR family transcriptional regulator [Streptomyces sp. GMY02]|uniref:TetR/AcrR family transcriptional regulator n=1 Tax=Streptomyces sp. GMY02 TaxID=1333528 RepID=UPI001C2C267E|nr:TetR/AcrR family transcriptional regulator [Streptomyces sp. GMY02]QXE33263.1 TetR/AcrR family transcriptional regulator [Streptomyces sp. GMY02]
MTGQTAQENTAKPAVRTRRRGAALEAAILSATWDVLVEDGYEHLTMDAVAARAGTSKPVLYRRWSSRAELLLAAVLDKFPTPAIPDQDHGDLRADLIALLQPLADRFAAVPPESVGQLNAAMANDAELTQLIYTRVGQVDLRSPLERILQRATLRGDYGGAPVTARVVALPLALLRAESLRGLPVPGEAIVRIVEDILLPLFNGLSSPANTRHTAP